MSKEIIIEEDTKTETKEMILDLPEGERGITEEETETEPETEPEPETEQVTLELEMEEEKSNDFV